ncbi:hypothetical protein U91I_03102 [alpha proteobacterium U9-1i]|nr:hypothetical protein U91I_03102 [alpha proteobacterium U9-1i]
MANERLRRPLLSDRHTCASPSFALALMGHQRAARGKRNLSLNGA